jgi:iron only hydrogenase large subunit-like protein
MSKLLHVIQINASLCTGKLACMRACPTKAMRVRRGKVTVNGDLCIDCGSCIVACPEKAITPQTDPWEKIEEFKFKIAIITPVLFSQFPRAISPQDIIDGLLGLGFDAVNDLSLESELYFRSVKDYLDDYTGPLPIISSTCPAVVRLIQVLYPDMVAQITPIQPPREIAGMLAKRKYSEQLGIDLNDIGAIYITPCPAKMASIKEPAEGVRSNLDMALGINDIYNPLLAWITRNKKNGGNPRSDAIKSQLGSTIFLNLPITGGLSRALKQKRYITVAQLPNIVQVFEDIEMGKIRHIDFLECFSCTGGCVGGPLTVDERFVARSKLLRIIAESGPENQEDIDALVEKYYEKGAYNLTQPLKPRPVQTPDSTIMEQIARVKTREDYINLLPGINCGLCGAPTCETFANDVANGQANPSDCILLSPDRLRILQKIYKVSEDSIEDK